MSVTYAHTRWDRLLIWHKVPYLLSLVVRTRPLGCKAFTSEKNGILFVSGDVTWAIEATGAMAENMRSCSKAWRSLWLCTADVCGERWIIFICVALFSAMMNSLFCSKRNWLSFALKSSRQMHTRNQRQFVTVCSNSNALPCIYTYLLLFYNVHDFNCPLTRARYIEGVTEYCVYKLYFSGTRCYTECFATDICLTRLLNKRVRG